MTQAEKDAVVPGGGEADLGVEAERLISGARDAMTDDMVSRLSATMGGGLDLLDRINRSGVGDALPALADLVKNGDLERVVHLARVVSSAQDATTDDIVGRLAGTASSGLDLLDRVNRSGVDRVLPAITRLVENGDLERVVDAGRVLGSASEALTEDMVNRFARMATEMMSVVDRLTRSDGLLRMIRILEREDMQTALVEILESVCGASKASVQAPAPAGGIGGLWKVVKEPETQEAIQFVTLISKQMRLRREACTNTPTAQGV